MNICMHAFIVFLCEAHQNLLLLACLHLHICIYLSVSASVNIKSKLAYKNVENCCYTTHISTRTSHVLILSLNFTLRPGIIQHLHHMLLYWQLLASRPVGHIITSSMQVTASRLFRLLRGCTGILWMDGCMNEIKTASKDVCIVRCRVMGEIEKWLLLSSCCSTGIRWL